MRTGCFFHTHFHFQKRARIAISPEKDEVTHE